jgi:dihydroorotase
VASAPVTMQAVKNSDGQKPVNPLLIQGGHIIDPGLGIDETGDLLVVEERISRLLGHIPALPRFDVLNATGMIVCPGFIDLHCHLRQPGYEEKETIASGTRAAVRGGFTTVCCMPNTNPPLDNVKMIDYVKQISSSEASARVLPIGSVTCGRKGYKLVNMREMAEAGVLGYSDDGNPVATSSLMRRALEFSVDSGLPIIEHCEDTDLSRGGLMHEGDLSARLGLPGIPSASEEIIIARDILLARLTGGWLHIAHVSSEGSVDLIRHAKRNGIRVTAEVTPHHLTLTEELVEGYDTSAKVNPPLRTRKDTEALLAGLKDNIIDIIATDHAPHTDDDKLEAFDRAPFGISSLETALGSLLNLVHSGDLSLPTLIAKLSTKPGKLIGKSHEGLGTLSEGSLADITIFDPNREWVVDTSTFFSKGRNTPLKGTKLKGMVVATIVKGKLVYREGEIKK